jgi:hypothetical protein
MEPCEESPMPWRKILFGVLVTAMLLVPRAAYACPS